MPALHLHPLFTFVEKTLTSPVLYMICIVIEWHDVPGRPKEDNEIDYRCWTMDLDSLLQPGFIVILTICVYFMHRSLAGSGAMAWGSWQFRYIGPTLM
jgi:hypothetical protein